MTETLLPGQRLDDEDGAPKLEYRCHNCGKWVNPQTLAGMSFCPTPGCPASLESVRDGSRETLAWITRVDLER